MSNTPAHILLNPASGGGRALHRWRRMERRARGVLGPFTVHLSAEPGELERIAAELRDTDSVLVAGGGDGTSHEVVNGLVRDPAAGPPRAAMAWLPLGSGNDLARSAGVPGRAMDGLELIRRARPRPIDAARVRFLRGGAPATRIVGNSLTAGLSGRVLQLVPRRGPLRGRAGYAVAAVRALATGRPVPLAVEADGRPVFESATWLVAITNGAYFGAGMLAAPGARVDDGRLHLLTVDPLPRLRALALFPRIYSGRHVDHEAVSRHAVGQARLSAGETLVLETDGELLTATPPIEIELLPGALTAIVGPL